ncbi:MAG: hypothetical protein U0794_07570 [Isosphaeraceae bacterium]
MTATEPEPPIAWTCARCGVALTRGRGETYWVEIRAVADPAPPVFDAEDLARDTEQAIAELLRHLGSLTERQLTEQVYRRRLHLLCAPCYAEWTDDPFGRSDLRTSR